MLKETYLKRRESETAFAPGGGLVDPAAGMLPPETHIQTPEDAKQLLTATILA